MPSCQLKLVFEGLGASLGFNFSYVYSFMRLKNIGILVGWELDLGREGSGGCWVQGGLVLTWGLLEAIVQMSTFQSSILFLGDRCISP